MGVQAAGHAQTGHGPSAFPCRSAFPCPSEWEYTLPHSTTHLSQSKENSQFFACYA